MSRCTRAILLLIIIVVTTLSLLTGGAAAYQDSPSLLLRALSQPLSQVFPETGHTVTGKFLAYWQEHGGLAQQGYPISEEMQERSDTDGKTYTVQYFERAVFELHPENAGTQYEVLLSLLGVLQYSEQYPQGAPQQVPNIDTSSIIFPETGKRVGGKFLEYWQTYGGLAQQGFPISDEFSEVSALDGKRYTVQYFERAVFELHPENAGTQYEVLLSQLGRFQLDRHNKSNATPIVTNTVGPTATSVLPTATPVPTAVIPAEATDWLKEHSIQIRTIEADNSDYTDLLPFKDIVGDARIVGMGEASHGAHEFAAMKGRTFRFLVQEMGFTVFAIEDSYAESEIINNYIQGGQGSAEEVIKGLDPFPWQTQELLDTIKWMRQYNENRNGAPAISFQGFDMQAPELPIKNVVAYLQIVDPPAAALATNRYRCFASPYTYSSNSQETKIRCRTTIGQVYDELTQRRASYVDLSSAQEFARAQHYARIVMQSEDYFSGGSGTATSGKRDRYMAENVAWIMDQAGPGAKAMLWAHNGHVETVSYNNVESMGQFLREQYGDAMRVFGFDFYKGSFNAFSVIGGGLGPMSVHTIPASRAGSYASYFHSVGVPYMALDLRNVGLEDPASNWLVGPLMIWGVGGAFNDADPYSAAGAISLTQAFDALIFVDAISPTTLLWK